MSKHWKVYILLRRPSSFPDNISRHIAAKYQIQNFDVGFLVWRGLGDFYVLTGLGCFPILRGLGCFCVLRMLRCVCILRESGCFCALTGPGCLHICTRLRCFCIFTRPGCIFIRKDLGWVSMHTGSGMSVPSQGWGVPLSSHCLFPVNVRK